MMKRRIPNAIDTTPTCTATSVADTATDQFEFTAENSISFLPVSRLKKPKHHHNNNNNNGGSVRLPLAATKNAPTSSRRNQSATAVDNSSKSKLIKSNSIHQSKRKPSIFESPVTESSRLEQLRKQWMNIGRDDFRESDKIEADKSTATNSTNRSRDLGKSRLLNDNSKSKSSKPQPAVNEDERLEQLRQQWMDIGRDSVDEASEIETENSSAVEPVKRPRKSKLLKRNSRWKSKSQSPASESVTSVIDENPKKQLQLPDSSVAEESSLEQLRREWMDIGRDGHDEDIHAMIDSNEDPETLMRKKATSKFAGLENTVDDVDADHDGPLKFIRPISKTSTAWKRMNGKLDNYDELKHHTYGVPRTVRILTRPSEAKYLPLEEIRDAAVKSMRSIYSHIRSEPLPQNVGRITTPKHDPWFVTGRFSAREVRFIEQAVFTWLKLNGYTIDYAYKFMDENLLPLTQFHEISDYFPWRPSLRLYEFCKHHFTQMKTGAFSEAELEWMFQLMDRYGKNWLKIGRIMGRVGFAVRDKWRYMYMRGSSPWTPEEDKKLVFLIFESHRKVQELLLADRDDSTESIDTHEELPENARIKIPLILRPRVRKALVIHLQNAVQDFSNLSKHVQLPETAPVSNIQWTPISCVLGSRSHFECRMRYSRLLLPRLRGRYNWMDWTRSEDIYLIWNLINQHAEAFDEVNWTSFHGKWTELTAKSRWKQLTKKLKSGENRSFTELNLMLLNQYKNELMSMTHPLEDVLAMLETSEKERTEILEREQSIAKCLDDPFYEYDADDDFENENLEEEPIGDRPDDYNGIDEEIAVGTETKSKLKASSSKKSHAKTAIK